MSQDAKRSLLTNQLAGAGLVIVLVFGLGGWAARASINGAVIASATVVVESNAKKVQHVEGGIISEIHVETGDHVTAGDLLVRLDQTEPKAELAILNARLNELHASHARLKAERDEADAIDFVPELNERAHDGEVQNILNGQRRLFLARAKDRRGKKEQLTQRIIQLNEEITGLKAQQVAKEEQIALIGRELEGLLILREKQLVPLTRLLALQREKARLDGERGQLIAQIARAKGRIAETELVIIQVDGEARTEVLTELRQVETNLVEYLERRSAARTRLKRTEIFA
ncbi:MAG: biotin/lipoyl-binding protein, partial [Hyphomicrobium sp.]|nr:biotin/lipoyl-binding protein [Hyphomicrobium sp.]